jgi:hypothetical protein
MAMLARCAIGVAVAGLIAALPAQALASSQDLAATHAYLEANYALSRTGVGLIHREQSNVERLNAKLAQECPNVGAGSPESEASEPMSYEVAVALWSVLYGTAAGSIQTFQAAVKPLHWSSPRITHLTQRYAGDLHELATLSRPNLCADVTAWKATHYETVPASVISLQHRVEAIQPEPVPNSLLVRFESGADRALAASTAKLETKLLNAETVIGFNDWDQVLATLGLQQ